VNDTNNQSSDTYTGTERLLAFSDGVFAIAITLLVLNIGVPHVAHGLLAKVLQQWPHYLGYVLSFFVIGIIWAQHHEMFVLIKRSNHTFVLINIIFLMWVAVVPFPTALLAEGLSSADAPGRRAALVIYTGMFLLGALLVNLQWRYARVDRRLLAEDANDSVVRRTTRSYAVGPVVYLIDLLVAFISVEASLALFCLIALFYAIAPMPAIHRVISGSGQAEDR
jgi:uncharacterized membrane protein